MHLLEKLQFSFTEKEVRERRSPNLDALGSVLALSTVDMPSSYVDTTSSVVTGQGDFEKPQTFNTFCLFLISALTSVFA